jgi:hypothetical protein
MNKKLCGELRKKGKWTDGCCEICDYRKKCKYEEVTLKWRGKSVTLKGGENMPKKNVPKDKELPGMPKRDELGEKAV